MAIKENSKKVFEYVKANDGKLITANDIAAATGLTSRSVNGIVTSAFQKKGLMKRSDPQEIELSDGTHKMVRIISLTEAGKEFDPDAPDEE